LLKGKTAVIQEVAEEMDRRDPLRSLTRVALTDGERALQIRVEQKLKVTLILDLMHALEKLWKAAYVFHAEGNLEADLWVLDRTLQILFGEVGQVVKGIRQSITKRRLTGPKRKTLNAVANYLYRNRTRMRYHEYLAKGWPIASGPVEGVCKNLIKDRMERSGMRWTVQLRAIYLRIDAGGWRFQRRSPRCLPARRHRSYRRPEKPPDGSRPASASNAAMLEQPAALQTPAASSRFRFGATNLRMGSPNVCHHAHHGGTSRFGDREPEASAKLTGKRGAKMEIPATTIRTARCRVLDGTANRFRTEVQRV